MYIHVYGRSNLCGFDQIDIRETSAFNFPWNQKLCLKYSLQFDLIERIKQV